MTMQEIIDAVEKSGAIPTPPDVVTALLDVCAREDHSGNEIAAIVARDPVLAGKMLRFSNSAFLGLPHEITSLQRAVGILGTRAVVTTALSLSVIGRPFTMKCSGFDDPQFRLQSLACGIAAQELAHRVGGTSEPEAFMAGSLSQLGRAILAAALPEEYSIVLTGAPSIPRGLPLLEQHACGSTYPEVGAAMLRKWGVPERLCSAVECFRERRTPSGPILARILEVAEVVAAMLCPSQGSVDSIEDEWPHVAEELLELSCDDAMSALTLIGTRIREMRAHYDVGTARMLAPHELEACLRQRVAELSVGACLEKRAEDSDPKAALARASSDLLTGVANKEAFDERLALEVQRARRDSAGLALLLVELDDFDVLSSECGEEVAEDVLRRTASAMREEVRSVDHLSRIGDQLFAIIAPRGSCDGVVKLARRLQEALREAFSAERGRPASTTVSVGAAVSSGGTQPPSPNEFVLVASQRLVAAMELDRNNIELALDGKSHRVPAPSAS